MNPKRLLQNYFSRVIFIFYGLICTVWFIIRTGRKPSRFVYPCQQASVNQSLFLWTYLIGSIPSIIKKLFNQKSKKLISLNYYANFNQIKKSLIVMFLVTCFSVYAFNYFSKNISHASNSQSLAILDNSTIYTHNNESKLFFNNNPTTVTLISSDDTSLSKPAPLDTSLDYGIYVSKGVGILSCGWERLKLCNFFRVSTIEKNGKIF